MKAKQKLILAIAIVPLILMLVYFGFAFVQWNFNAGKWSETVRFGSVFVSLAALAFSMIGILSISDKK